MNRSALKRAFRNVSLAMIVGAAGIGAMPRQADAAISIHIGGGGGLTISFGDARKTVDLCASRMKATVDRTERLVNIYRDLGVRVINIYGGALRPGAAKNRLIQSLADRYTHIINLSGTSTALLVNREADACIARLTRFHADEEFIAEVEAAREVELARFDAVKIAAIEEIAAAAEAALDD